MKICGIIFVSVLMLGSFAQAKSFARLAYSLSTEIEKYEEIDLSLEDLQGSLFSKLQERAEYESNIWGDTILEGDYEISQDAVALNAVSSIYNSRGIFVAYRIIYSVRAWDVADCEFDGSRLHQASAQEYDEIFKDCIEGVIIGNSFVSPGFKRSERDFNNMEYFENLFD